MAQMLAFQAQLKKRQSKRVSHLAMYVNTSNQPQEEQYGLEPMESGWLQRKFEEQYCIQRAITKKVLLKREQIVKQRVQHQGTTVRRKQRKHRSKPIKTANNENQCKSLVATEHGPASDHAVLNLSKSPSIQTPRLASNSFLFRRALKRFSEHRMSISRSLLALPFSRTRSNHVACDEDRHQPSSPQSENSTFDPVELFEYMQKLGDNSSLSEVQLRRKTICLLWLNCACRSNGEDLRGFRFGDQECVRLFCGKSGAEVNQFEAADILDISFLMDPNPKKTGCEDGEPDEYGERLDKHSRLHTVDGRGLSAWIRIRRCRRLGHSEKYHQRTCLFGALAEIQLRYLQRTAISSDSDESKLFGEGFFLEKSNGRFQFLSTKKIIQEANKFFLEAGIQRGIKADKIRGVAMACWTSAKTADGLSMFRQADVYTHARQKHTIGKHLLQEQILNNAVTQRYLKSVAAAHAQAGGSLTLEEALRTRDFN